MERLWKKWFGFFFLIRIIIQTRPLEYLVPIRQNIQNLVQTLSVRLHHLVNSPNEPSPAIRAFYLPAILLSGYEGKCGLLPTHSPSNSFKRTFSQATGLIFQHIFAPVPDLTTQFYVNGTNTLGPPSFQCCFAYLPAITELSLGHKYLIFIPIDSPVNFDWNSPVLGLPLAL